MKIRILTKHSLAALTLALCFSAPAFAAATFKDVPVSHWAYQSIVSVADRNLMVGDTAGSFKPDALIDKFETAKILARAAGYKYTGISEAELTNYNLAYEKNKSVLTGFEKTFTKWNSSADREIAFLLEKEVFTTDDLNQFVVKDASGTEKLRALSREESAVFLVKLIGRKNEALTQGAPKEPFKDDAGIATAAKPYVYYLKAKNVIAGGTDGNFSPNAAVSRASMAVLLDKTLAMAKDSAVPSGLPGVSTVNSVSGTYDLFYTQLGAVQITLADGNKKIYKLSSNTAIYVDGFLKTVSDLKEGMQLVATVANEEELMEVKAVSPAGSNPSAPMATEASAQAFYVEGIVSALNAGADVKSLEVEVRMLNPRGEIITETRKYTLSLDTSIKRGEALAAVESIVKGDVVRVDYIGSTATSVMIEEKDRTFTNMALDAKKFVEQTSTPILVLKDENGKTFDLRVTDKTSITRNGSPGVAWKDLRVGDVVTAKSEYDALLTVSATGTRSEAEGVVREIHLTKDASSIVFLNTATNLSETYGLITSSLDIYALRLGSTVKLRLDSREVESFTVTAAATNDSTPVPTDENTAMGYIVSNSGGVIMLNSAKGGGGTSQEVKYDAYTIATNVATGARVKPNTLTPGQKVTIVFTASSSNTAKTISLLAD